MSFLPITKEEVGGRQVDVVYVIGEAYVDHPSFGHAIVSRLLQSLGIDVAIIPQPQTPEDFMRLESLYIVLWYQAELSTAWSTTIPSPR